MDLVMLLLVLAVVATIAAIALGRLPGGMPDPSSTVPPVRLPDGPIAGGDVHRLRFVPGLRGYRMDQVDQVLDRLAREVDQLRSLVPPERLQSHDRSLSQPTAPEVLEHGFDGEPQRAQAWAPVSSDGLDSDGFDDVHTRETGR